MRTATTLVVCAVLACLIVPAAAQSDDAATAALTRISKLRADLEKARRDLKWALEQKRDRNTLVEALKYGKLGVVPYLRSGGGGDLAAFFALSEDDLKRELWLVTASSALEQRLRNEVAADREAQRAIAARETTLELEVALRRADRITQTIYAWAAWQKKRGPLGMDPAELDRTIARYEGEVKRIQGELAAEERRYNTSLPGWARAGDTSETPPAWEGGGTQYMGGVTAEWQDWLKSAIKGWQSARACGQLP